MYLIIGSAHEPCAHAVAAALRHAGHVVTIEPDPFGPSGRLRWRFDTRSASLDYRAAGAPCDPAHALQGVFVRHFAGIQDTSGWSVEDLAYMRSEAMAALLAWLHALDCPVVGRVGDDAWYRPRRPLPEWVSVLAASGLPTPRVVVTSVAEAERHEREWRGRAVYQPLTSARRYAIEGDGWAELAKVMRHVPVCLTEAAEAPPGAVTLACGHIFWSAPGLSARDRLEIGVRSVAERLGADFIQLTYTNGSAGPRFTGVNVAPVVELHGLDDQQAMAARIAEALAAGGAPLAPLVGGPAAGPEVAR